MKFNSEQVDTSFWGFVKAVFYIIGALIGASLDYAEIERSLLATLTILMFADWVTGLLKAWKLKIDITSKRSNKGVIEKICLLAIPIAIAFTFKTVGIEMSMTIKSAFTMLIVAELYSLVGNCYCIYTGVDEKEFDAVTAVLKFIRGSVFKVLRNFMKDKDDSGKAQG